MKRSERRVRTLVLSLGTSLLQLVVACTFDGAGVSAETPRSLPLDGAVGMSVQDTGPDHNVVSPASDATPDGAPDSAAGTAQDSAAGAADSTAIDASPPDSLVDARGTDARDGVSIDESFEHSMGQLQPRRGSWTVAGGELVQSTTNVNGAVATGQLAASDYVLEAALSIDHIEGLARIIEGAGLAARFEEEQPSNGERIVAQYVCMATPEDGGRLLIGKAPGNTSSYSGIAGKSAHVELRTRIRIRFTLQGSRLVCELPDQQIRVETNEGSYSSGEVGPATLYGAASFEYFLATPLGGS